MMGHQINMFRCGAPPPSHPTDQNISLRHKQFGIYNLYQLPTPQSSHCPTTEIAVTNHNLLQSPHKLCHFNKKQQIFSWLSSVLVRQGSNKKDLVINDNGNWICSGMEIR